MTMKLDNTQIALIGAAGIAVIAFGLWYFGYLGGTDADLAKQFKAVSDAFSEYKKATGTAKVDKKRTVLDKVGDLNTFVENSK